jgi:hypothetical protein
LEFSFGPRLGGSRPDLLSGLRRDSAVSILHVHIPVRSLLIVMQVAAAEVLLSSAGLKLAACGLALGLAMQFPAGSSWRRRCVASQPGLRRR